MQGSSFKNGSGIFQRGDRKSKDHRGYLNDREFDNNRYKNCNLGRRSSTAEHECNWGHNTFQNLLQAARIAQDAA